ncbi:hypothetical protein CHS0354_001589 [Potamilus streckersoni]|uniref:Guanylate-binding protein/Atlastin C-terminal domain-containing protein n=1 Tax=Potamilus streckersoni TaxID=2493646 RepID=A0AAE0W4Q8_9BIVA|nr:hypothetical protein CHS0354_001589 [Potamilus streckersoni]
MDIRESSSNFDQFFPTFILTLRDFYLNLEVDGKPITSDKYFEDVCLEMQKEPDKKGHDNNMARQCIRDYFKTRKCFTFDRPGGTDVLRTLEDLEDSALSKEFLKDSKLFTDYVYNECPPKQLNNGQPVNGRRFVIIVEQYVDAIRNGGVPNVLGALAAMVMEENKRAVNESMKTYKSGMSENQITKEYENFRTQDQQASVEESQKALGKMDAEIKQKVADGRYHCRDGYKLYQKDMEKLKTDFCALTRLGSKKTDVLQKYLSDIANRGEIIMQADATLTQKEIEMEVERQRIADADRKIEAEKRLLEEQQRLLEEKNQRNKEALELMKQKQEKEIQNERDNLEKITEKRREEMERLANEGMLIEAERMKLNMEKAQKEIDEYKNEGSLSLLGRAAKGFIGKLKFW